MDIIIYEPYGTITISQRARLSFMSVGALRSLLKLAGDRCCNQSPEAIGRQLIELLNAESCRAGLSKADLNRIKKRKEVITQWLSGIH